MKRLCKLLACLVAIFAATLVAAAPDASAATLYVDAANVSGVEDGTQANPYNTIQEAIDAAAENDTVSVARGIYYGTIQLGKGIQVVSQEGPRVTVLDGVNQYAVNGYYVNSYKEYLIKGFSVTGSMGLVSLIRTGRLVMEECIFRDAPFGLYLSLGSNFVARKCVISNIQGIAVHSMFNGGPVFQNVTLDRADRGFQSIYSNVRPFNLSVSNVNLAFFTSPSYWGYYHGSNVNVWNAQEMASDPASVNIANLSFADPRFVEPPADYRLQAGSPLIDAGIDVGLPYVGAAPDIGAFEFADLTLAEQVENLASSFAGAPAEVVRGPVEQRQTALYQKFEAILKMVYIPDDTVRKDSRLNVLKGALGKLKNDVLAKVDGSSGGNPNDDWIADGPEKVELYNQVLTVIADVEKELAGTP